MSGDVQPRKRKDKRKKKEGGSAGSIYEPELIHRHKKSESDHKSFDLPDQGEKIHVQNEHGIGGNICVKIIFFCLFGLLIGAVGLIYLQSQGSTDVDLPTVEESRFAEYFTGWLDDSNDEHEHEAVEQGVGDEHDEHDDHDEHEDNDEQEEHDDDDEHEKEDTSAEQDSIFKFFGLQGDEEKEEVEETDTATSDFRESEETGSRDDEDEEEDENSEDEDDKNEKEDDEDSGVEEEDDNDDEDDASQVDENEQEETEEDETEKQEDDEISEENMDDEEEQEQEEKEESKEEQEEEEEASNEADKIESDETEDEKTNDDLGYDEIYESEEDEEEKEEVEEVSDEDSENPKEEVSEEEVEKATVTEAQSEEEEEEDEESGGVAVKLVVGIALIIVAHLVLVQKWKSMSDASSTHETEVKSVTGNENVENVTTEAEPVISRRQTLVPENVSLNDDWEEAEEEEEEEELKEDEIEEEPYSEEEEIEEEEIKKTEKENLETFEKLSWNDDDEKEAIDDDYEEEGYNDEEDEADGEDDGEEEEEEKEYEVEEEEEEYGGEEEEVENEEEGEYEEDIEDEYEDKNKKLYVEEVKEPPRAEIKPEDVTPTPPPRAHKGGRGGQDFDESIIEQFEDVSETGEDDVREFVRETVSEFEEPRPIESKPGNEDDWTFKEDFDFAEEQFENNPKAAVRAYEKILSKKPTAVRALIGRARALDHLAEKERSNAYLKQAINAYKTVFLENGHLIDDDTYVKLSERCIERIRFSGAFSSAIDVHKALIMKFPQTPKYRNALAVTYLMLNRIPQARALLNETLTLWPEDGFALVHYGFILKTSDNNMEEGAKKLIAGIETKQEGVIDGMFLFHLGDALNRLGRGHEATKWYELGVKEGLFLSKYQRSLYNVNRLKSRPWWTKEQTTYQDFFRKLEQNWREIRKEGLELLNSKGKNLFKEEAENLKDTGDWKQLDLYFRGRKQPSCSKAPITCGLVSSFKPASTCTRGQIKFSVMFPGTHVWPHCGPTNCRLRSHLGLVVPKKTYIRVAEETRSWEEGKLIIFDDSFEHEVWHNGSGLRLVLIVDVWHPELTNHERLTLSPI